MMEQRWEKMDKKIHSGMMLTLLLTSIVAFNLSTTQASPDTTLYVDPEVSTADPAESFTVNVTIAGVPNGVPNVFAYETRLAFDGDVLEAVDVDEGPYIKDQTTSPMGTFFESGIDREISGEMKGKYYAYALCMTLGAYPGVTGSGVLFTVTFTVKAAGVSALNLYKTIILDGAGCVYNSTDVGGPIVEFDGDFHTTLPVASFIFTPDTYGRPMPGEIVTFDASASYDPDGGPIVSYSWDFGDGTSGTGMIATHIYDNVTSFGPDEPYAVTLTIVDDDGATNTGSRDVHVKLHDIAVLEIVAAPLEVLLGDIVTINATVLNNGTHPEMFNVTIYRNDTPIYTRTVMDLLPGTNDTLTFEWDTTEVARGTYVISAYAYLVEPLPGLKYIARPGEEEDTSDNKLVGNPIVVTPILPRTIGELKTEIEELGLRGEIDNHGIVKSLLAKLNAAQKLVDKGKTDEAKSILEEDFIPQVQNLTDIHITPEAAELLIESAEYIVSNL